MRKYEQYMDGSKIRIAFMIQVVSYWASVESVYEALCKDERVDVRVYWVNESTVEKVQLEGTDFFLTELQIPYEIYDENRLLKFSPHAVVYQSPYDMAYRKPNALSLHLKNMGVRIVYIPYGIEIADTEDARAAHFDTFVVRNAWRVYTLSEQMKKEYEKYCANRQAVRALGTPKFDKYYRGDVSICEEIEQRASGRKIVLWKMHFPKIIYENGKKVQVTPYLKEYERFGALIDKYRDLFFVIMPHPMFYSHTIHEKEGDRARKLFEILGLKENVYVDKKPDYRGSLYHSDAIIMDRSALLVESAIVGAPVLYMKNPDYAEPFTPPVEKLTSIYRTGTQAEDIMQFLDNFRENGVCALDCAEEIMDEILPYRDGLSGERIKEDIVKGILEDENSKIKLILFGLGYVCQYYIEYYHLLESKEYDIVAFSDNDREKWNTFWRGVPIVEPRMLRDYEYDYIIIMTENYHMLIKKQLIYEVCLDDERILRLDQFCEMQNNCQDL